MTIDDLAHDLEVPLLRIDPAEVYDAAIIGYARYRGATVLVYDQDLVIAQTVKHDGMSYEDAVDWHEFNTFDAWLGEGTPVFVRRVRHDP